MGALVIPICFATRTTPARAAEPSLDPQLWSQQGAALTVTDAAGAYDLFGGAVAVLSDRIVVGAPGHSLYGHISEGAVYSFERQGKQWVPDGSPLTYPTDSDYQYFGGHFALSSDSLFITAPFQGVSGTEGVHAVQPYSRTDTGWLPAGSPLIPSDASFQAFGAALAISGNTLVVGASYKKVGNNLGQGAAYIFERNGATWEPQGSPLVASNGAADDHFGGSVAISNDTIVIGADNKSPGLYAEQGAVYVFVRNGATWEEQAVLTDLEAPSGKHFGASVAIAGDTIAVGSNPLDYPSGLTRVAATLFNRVGTTWLSQPPVHSVTLEYGNPRYATSVALSEDANTLAIGTCERIAGQLGNGAGYIFARVGGAWQQQGAALHSSSTSVDNFGQAVALSGHTAVFGAPGGNAAYVYSNEPCLTDTDCPSAGYCAEGACHARCKADTDCALGAYCSESERCKPAPSPGSGGAGGTEHGNAGAENATAGAAGAENATAGAENATAGATGAENATAGATGAENASAGAENGGTDTAGEENGGADAGNAAHADAGRDNLGSSSSGGSTYETGAHAGRADSADTGLDANRSDCACRTGGSSPNGRSEFIACSLMAALFARRSRQRRMQRASVR